MKINKTIYFVVLVFLSLQSIGQLSLPAIFTNNMVLQCNKPVAIWGKAGAGKTVSVLLKDHTFSAKASADGQWKVSIPAQKPGENIAVLIQSGEEKIALSNIAFGEVWLCSGQSNMDFRLKQVLAQYRDDIKNNGSIRFVTINRVVNNKENNDVQTEYGWRQIDESSVSDCSAVAYFFAKKIQQKTGIPVGLIVSSWGGTPAQAWVDEQTIKDFPGYNDLFQNELKPLDFKLLDEKQKEADKLYQQKIANNYAEFVQYIDPAYDDSKWTDMMLPGNWEEKGYPDLDGLAAYRIAFTVGTEDAGKAAVLHLPAIDDEDSTFINGTFIGSHKVWNELRTYNIPASILKAGKNIITIKVFDGQGGGGLFRDSKNYFVQIGDAKIMLEGNAKFKILVAAEGASKNLNPSNIQNQPTVLFNAMIAPLLPLSIRGVIWYQGESNVPQYKEYRKLFPALITDWRKRFKQGNFPFLFVQLSSYNPAANEPALSDWAFLREAQTMTLALPNTGMAVTTDVGDKMDIHPTRKKEVGERLAAEALRLSYGFKNDIASGPAYKSSAVSGNKIILQFSNTGGGLWIKGNTLEGFSIAGADKVFVPATAVIKNNTVEVSGSIASPVYVRYAWANAPLNANLYNKEGFPAVPFRTDKD